MRIYLAARYSRHPEMRRYREDLKALGHTVTSRWISGDHHMAEATMFTNGDEEQARRFAQEDWDDLVEANCVISFTETPRSTNGRGGRHVEFGLAVAEHKQNIIVGPRENVFHYLKGVDVYETWEACLSRLKLYVTTGCHD